MKTLTKLLFESVSILGFFMLLTGVTYPLFVTGVSALIWPKERMGSLIEVNGKVRGSELLSQKTEGPKLFWPRPSAADFSTVPSGASNLAPSNKALQAKIEENRETLKTKGGLSNVIPEELLLTSGSGLDPHISLEGALIQIPRICAARHLNPHACENLSEQARNTGEAPTFGFLGRSRVNVNRLNEILEGNR